METIKIISNQDKLALDTVIFQPDCKPIGIIQFVHGMAEHKERYYPFMEYLTSKGYITVVHDQRGHGASVKNKSDLGYFYTDTPDSLAEDVFQINQYVKDKYKDIPVYLFSHSMGTLVSRIYLQKYDDTIEKIVLCGTPTNNPLAPVGIGLVKFNSLFFGAKHRSKLISGLTVGPYERKGEGKNTWLCTNPEDIEEYNKDELCGYTLTNNGFLNLYRLMRQAYNKSFWKVKNSELPIFIIAGEDDPVIQSKEKFKHLARFIGDVGYKNINTKLYTGLRHEILNELGKEKIWEDIYKFFQN